VRGGHGFVGEDAGQLALVAQINREQADVGADVEVDAVLWQVDAVGGKVISEDLMDGKVDFIGIHAIDAPSIRQQRGCEGGRAGRVVVGCFG
jgi:hypothetical protein